MSRSVCIEFFLFLKQMSFDPNLLHNNGHNGYPNGTSAALRETGVIEKLLTSYGFIQCSERQARLFFHCSQYNGNLQDLKVGGNLSVLLFIKLNPNFSCISTYSWQCYGFGLFIVPITEVCLYKSAESWFHLWWWSFWGMKELLSKRYLWIFFK